MAQKFTVRDIALQSGLSEATVDRVVNHRGGVRVLTQEIVFRAIAELERQQDQWHPSSATLFIDVIMWAPYRFSSAVQDAMESILNELGPQRVRARFDCREQWTVPKLIARLTRLGRQKTHGVILKVPDIPQVSEAINRLTDAGLAVMTLVTDVGHCKHLGYIGIDNYRAGATAAYLLAQWTPEYAKSMALIVSSNIFQGEVERETGFKRTLSDLRPGAQIHSVTNSDGMDHSSYQLMHELLEKDRGIAGVYSIGGGNFGVLKALEESNCRVCTVGHDLVRDNVLLLRQRKLNAVIHHDLREDMRQACGHLMIHHHEAKPLPRLNTSKLDVITPFNIPSRYEALHDT